MQRAIDALIDWCTLNRLPLNLSKCKIMTFHRSTRPLMVNYHVGSLELDRVKEHCDLGILLDNKMTYNWHIDTVIAKSYAMLGFIKRMCSNIDEPYALKSLYCAFIRSKLEFASIVWQPFYDVHIKRIE